MGSKLKCRFFLVFIVIASHNYGQSFDHDDLYVRGLFICVDSAARHYTEYSEKDYANVIVEDNLIVDDFPTDFGNFQVTYLNPEELRIKRQQSKEDFPIISIRPIRNRGLTLEIHYIDYWIELEEDNFMIYALEGGCEVEFTIDHQKKAYILSAVRLWGI